MGSLHGLTTAEAAQLAGVATTTVKRWADQGLLPFERTPGGHRRFERAAIERVLREQRSGDGGDPLIGSWLDHLLRSQRYVLDGQLLAARARLGAWYRVADELGLVLEELGKQWESGGITIAQEHTASECLARALTRVSDTMPLASVGPTYLLACAPGDDHTLGLCLTELCLREAGRRTLWLGRKTPLGEILRLVGDGHLAMVAVSASAASTNTRMLGQFARELGAACAKARVDLVVGGAGSWPEHLAHATRVWSFAAFHEFLRVRENR
jgi:excisionase family DNA binding protein